MERPDASAPGERVDEEPVAVVEILSLIDDDRAVTVLGGRRLRGQGAVSQRARAVRAPLRVSPSVPAQRADMRPISMAPGRRRFVLAAAPGAAAMTPPSRRRP
jgi:hypothetical protein